MTLLQTILLSLIQGLTEFLPISSSAHLILVPIIAGWPYQGIAFDVAVHLGTLVAVCLYFRKEILRLTIGWMRSIQGKPTRYYSRLSWQLIMATLPISIIAWLSHDFVATHLRSPLVIACATISFGVLLLLSDKLPKPRKSMHEITWKDALIIGFAQTLALIPGTSRSGITLTAGLSLGLKRTSSAHFSFLLSIPVILLAGSYELLKLTRSPAPVDWLSLGVGITVAAVSAYFCIHAFLILLRKIGVLPFVIYRLILGAFLIFLFV